MKVSDLQTEAGKEIVSGIFKKQLSLKRDKDGNVVNERISPSLAKFTPL